jgi:hypothetical protein
MINASTAKAISETHKDENRVADMLSICDFYVKYAARKGRKDTSIIKIDLSKEDEAVFVNILQDHGFRTYLDYATITLYWN